MKQWAADQGLAGKGLPLGRAALHCSPHAGLTAACLPPHLRAAEKCTMHSPSQGRQEAPAGAVGTLQLSAHELHTQTAPCSGPGRTLCPHCQGCAPRVSRTPVSMPPHCTSGPFYLRGPNPVLLGVQMRAQWGCVLLPRGQAPPLAVIEHADGPRRGLWCQITRAFRGRTNYPPCSLQFPPPLGYFWGRRG